jgi:putative acetyltransferase
VINTAVRAERKDDYPDVRRVNEFAFGRVNEANLVEGLRSVANPYISLVAVRDRQIVGHIFFSPVSIESDSCLFAALGLAPMAVLPGYQRRGIGSELVREGLKTCERLGYDLVFVVGHPDYYPRFGFKPARQLGFDCEYAVPDEVFMVAELKPGAASARNGMVRYMPQFRGV